MYGRGPEIIIIVIKWKFIYIHTGKRLTYRVFSYQLGGSFSVGGVVLRSDALASALMDYRVT